MMRSLPILMSSILLNIVPATASPISQSSTLFKNDRTSITTSQTPLNSFKISQVPQDTPIVQIKDWTIKDAKLPWNQLALDKSSGAGEPVVFTKSYKFKVGFFSNHKERIHARWTQNKVEIAVMYGSTCSPIFGCADSASYALPKQIAVTINGRDYFLNRVDQNTYGLEPELKQTISQTSGKLAFKLSEKLKFEVKEEAVPALKRLFAMQSVSNNSSVNSSFPSVPSNQSKSNSNTTLTPKKALAN